jgi:hypothetical protein
VTKKADIAAYTAAAQAAYEGAEFRGLYTSPLHAAHCIGEHFQATGRTAPRDVRPSRGDLMHANDMLFRFDWRNVKHPTITRER